VPRAFVWLLLIQKRLFKKISFAVILLLVPLIAVSLAYIASLDSGTVTVALVNEGNGETAEGVINGLLEGGGIIRYKRYATENDALYAMEHGRVDCMWLFSEDFEQRLCDFAHNIETPVMKLYEREDTVMLKLSSEMLYAEIFPEISREIYLRFTQNDINTPDADEAELLAMYEKKLEAGNFIAFETVDGAPDEAKSYLLSPIKGLLCVVILISSFAAAIYNQEDEKRGVYARMKPARRIVPLMLNALVGALDCGAIAFVSCVAVGLTENALLELASMLMYIVLCASFAGCIGAILYKPEYIGGALPFVSICALLFSPVFFAADVTAVKYLIPVTYYVNSLQTPIFMLYGLGAAAIYVLLGWALMTLNTKRLNG